MPLCNLGGDLLIISFFLNSSECSTQKMFHVYNLQNNVGSVYSPVYKFPPPSFMKVQVLENRGVIHSLY